MTDVADAPSQTAHSSAVVGAPRRALPRRAAWLAAGSIVALVVAALFSVSLGTLRLDPFEAIGAVLDPADGHVATVVWSILLHRIVVALLVEGALAGVGVILMALFRNQIAISSDIVESVDV